MKEESKHGKLWAIIFIALIAAVIIGGALLISQRVGGEDPVEIKVSAQPAPEIEVYLSGAIASEGIYDVDENSTIGDLLRAAGGVTDDADISRIKIQVLSADESPYGVPEDSEAPEGSEEVAHTDAKININTASLEALMSLTGIGEVKAQAIIDYRNENGPFRSVEELVNVSGIGEKTLDKLRDQITVVD